MKRIFSASKNGYRLLPVKKSVADGAIADASAFQLLQSFDLRLFPSGSRCQPSAPLPLEITVVSTPPLAV